MGSRLIVPYIANPDFPNMIKMPPSPTRREHGDAPCEVLSVLTGGDAPWIAYRGERLGRWLAERGIDHGWCLLGDPEWLAEEVRARGARVIISEAQCIPAASVERLSAALPDVQIVQLFHGAPVWVASAAAGQTYESIRQSRDLPNVHVGVVSGIDAMTWLPGSKIVELPNPIEIPAGLETIDARETDEPLCVSLIARSAAPKNWGGMLAALGILARRRPIHALVSGHDVGLGREQSRYLADLGIDAETVPFGDWAKTLARVARSVDVGLCCGWTDALNLVAAEHCLLGIPVVGSPALDWLPPTWRVSPQDPVAMADLVEAHAANPQAGPRGRKIALALAAANEATLLANLRTLIEA